MSKIMNNYGIVFNKFIDAIKLPKGYCALLYDNIDLNFDREDLDFFHDIKVTNCTKDTLDIIYKGEKMSFDIKTIKLVAEMT